MRTCLHLASCLLISAALCAAQQVPVPVQDESHHHVQLKNDDVMLIRAQLEPGETTLYHIHSHDRIVLYLAPSTTTSQILGKPEGPPSAAKAGDLSADALTDAPMTHRVHTVSSDPLDVLDIEILHRPTQPTPPAAATVAVENPSARAYSWKIAPGTATPPHTHQRPYLIIAVTPMNLKMSAPDGRSLSETVKTGDFHWVDVPVTHSLANEGSEAGQIVEVELK